MKQKQKCRRTRERAPAITRKIQQRCPSTAQPRVLQAQRLRRLLKVSEPMAFMLAGFVYGEGRS